MQELAFPAGVALLLLITLNLSAAQRPGNYPASPSRIFPAMQAV
jgi:hypothetical protein